MSDINERASSNAGHPGSPYLVLGPRGEVRVCESDADISRASLLGLASGFFSGLIAYDAAGSRWRVAEVIAPYRSTFWTRLLANTIYNPRFSVGLVWQHDGSYALTELQDGICQAVDRDDDILTQSVPPERLKKIVRQCRSFDQIVARLREHLVV